MTPQQATLEIEPVVRAIVARKLRVSFYRTDLVETQNALDIVHDVLVEVLRRMQSAGSAPQHPREYAAVVAYHSCAEYLRAKRAPRRRLHLKLQYFLSHHADFCIWDNGDGDKACGYVRWQGRTAAGIPSQAALDTSALKSVDEMGPQDWVAPLRALFDQLQAPVTLADLVTLFAGRTLADAVQETELGEMSDPLGTPEQRAGVQELLQGVWRALLQIQVRWRRAFLLNPPRGFEVDVFPANGIADIEEIGATLDLSDPEYEMLWNALDLGSAERREAAALGGLRRFAVLWRYLPLRDAVIALILGKDAQYVINLRRLARDELAERLKEKKIR
jgi:DNA-directed RNA polymerase specialized sigma24 family protein